MIKIPYEELVEKIKQQSNLPETEIHLKIQDKLKQLSGLVSKEGAAHIIAQELGIKLIQNDGKIKNLYPGMKSISITGRAQTIYPPKTFQRQDGSTGSVGRFKLADETGSIMIVCWNDQTSMIEKVAPGIIVKVTNASARENRGYLEAHLNEQSKIILNPPGENIPEIQTQQSTTRKNIKELKETDGSTELLGTIVQVFNPTYYETCLQCNKRIRPDPQGQYTCDTHGPTQPDYGIVLNIYLDDGTDTIRCVFFRETAQTLLNKTKQELIALKEHPEQFEPLKTDLLGTITKVTGRPRMNTVMNRLEFTVNNVNTNPNPEEELRTSELTTARSGSS